MHGIAIKDFWLTWKEWKLDLQIVAVMWYVSFKDYNNIIILLVVYGAGRNM